MIYNYKEKYVPLAQKLRKNMTKEEKHLWYDFLKKLPITVNRQKNIGEYIVDFFVSSKRLAIEIDGAQHRMREKTELDKKRDGDLNNLGIKVIRYSNKDIKENFNVVCDDILKHLELNATDMKNL